MLAQCQSCGRRKRSPWQKSPNGTRIRIDNPGAAKKKMVSKNIGVNVAGVDSMEDCWSIRSEIEEEMIVPRDKQLREVIQRNRCSSNSLMPVK